MENDLISRSELLENYGLKDAVKYGNKTREQAYHSVDTLMLYEIADMIESAPAVDAVPVVHGRWIKALAYDFAGSLEGYKCNICGRFCTDNTEPYCHCGAKMDGKDDAK